MHDLADAAHADIAFAVALRDHEAGRVAEAAAGYRRILCDQPDHADSLHLLGLLAAQGDDATMGAELIARAIRLKPGQAPFHNSLAFALRALGRVEEAVHVYRDAVALRPLSAEIHNNLAGALHELGQYQDAIGHYRVASRHAPDRAEIWCNLATALGEQGDDIEACSCFCRSVALRPDYAEAWFNFGRWRATKGNWQEAEACLTNAIRSRPGHAPSWCTLARVLQELNRGDDAKQCCRHAIVLDPNLAAAHYNLGCMLALDGDPDGAVACHTAAIAADPTHGAARLAVCMSHLPILYRSQGEIAERRQSYANALKALAAADAKQDAILARSIGTAQPFFLAYQQQDDTALQALYGGLACRVLAATQPPARLAPAPVAGERIRVGIVSGFFRDHTIWKLFLEGWLTQFDRSRFALIGFHTGLESDRLTTFAKQHCDRFVQCPAAVDPWRDAIAREAPHVLLYPEVGIDPIAGRLAAQRLARVQCSAWGHPDTTGMPTIDFFLSSELMEPPNADEFYTERLVRLPNLGLHFRPGPGPERRLDRSEFGMHPTGLVYWSGQALYKYLPDNDFVYPRIAAQVGPCQFVFIDFAKSKSVTVAFRERLARAFAAAGLDADRYCLFLPPMKQDRFIEAVGLADLVLDTIGWSGGKSTLDCLAQDPVIVTMEGRFMRGRHTAAILRRIGLADIVAASVDEYIATAVTLGRDPAKRAALRQRVAQGKHRAFDDALYMRALEAFLVQVVAA